MPRIPPSLSRTSSMTSTTSTMSLDSSDDAASTGTSASERRTRKRFTNVQLMMLETLYHRDSHPSREEREALARTGGMETKSVTIWFQNKRQTERKVALYNTTNTNTKISSQHRVGDTYPSTPTMTLNIPSSISSISSSSSTTSRRPSLDHVASRRELCVAFPTTPTRNRKRDPDVALWEHMPSSPVGPPMSPPAREYVEFGTLKRTRTLEWACARRRLVAKEGGDVDDGDETEDACDEAVTPPSARRGNIRWTENARGDAVTPPSASSWGKGYTRWIIEPGGKMTVMHKGVQDDEMLRAALALCGLGQSHR